MKSSGDLVRLFNLYSANEFHAFNDVRQVREAAQFSPAVVGTLAKLEHHVQQTVARHTALRSCRAVTDGGKGRLDRVRCSKMLPVQRRKIIKCHY